MAAKILTKENLQNWINKMTAGHEVFAPLVNENNPAEVSFVKIKEGQKPDLDMRTTVSLKGILFKQVEKLLSYERGADGINIDESCACGEGRSLEVLFGARPCDARSFLLTDKPFGGEELLALITCQETIAEASAGDIAKAKEISEKVTLSMEVLKIPTIEALDKLFKDEDFWKKLTEKCLSCGACTFICPTCYCFDVRDEGNVNTGDRYRRWDSCMFFQYNRAAGGHNPRDAHWKRMRQRMLHKFCYFVEKYGDIDCVGCGRCIRSCPVSYDIRDFIKEAFVATGGEAANQAKPHAEFIDELPAENDEPFVCEMKSEAMPVAEAQPQQPVVEQAVNVVEAADSIEASVSETAELEINTAEPVKETVGIFAGLNEIDSMDDPDFDKVDSNNEASENKAADADDATATGVGTDV
ncbi:MAG: 4Fe-4S dicluster domain-containing protein [Rubrobacteridae bacterium]|nr:4Fe-4S dicluster domain-containing protein [Rubrobacteridae bacterium]